MTIEELNFLSKKFIGIYNSDLTEKSIKQIKLEWEEFKNQIFNCDFSPSNEDQLIEALKPMDEFFHILEIEGHDEKDLEVILGSQILLSRQGEFLLLYLIERRYSISNEKMN